MTPKPAQDKPAGKVKLTKAQLEVLYELSPRGGWTPVWMLSKNYGRGKGSGRRSTCEALLRLGLLTKHKEGPLYQLSENGRRALRESSK